MFPPLRLRQAFTLGGLTPREAATRTWKAIGEHEILTRASAVAFYAMLALVPFLALILTVAVQLLPDVTGGTAAKGVGDMTVEQFRGTLQSLFPREAYAVFKDTIEQQIARIQKEPPVALLTVGLGVALWLASSLFMAVIDAMNVIYGVKETRSYVRLRLVAVVMTIIQAGILLGALIAIVAWPQILGWFGLGTTAAMLATAVKWLVVSVMVLTSFALAFYVGPDAHQRWEWISPGSLIGAGAFLAASLGFRVYVQNFANYDKTYGSLGGVMVLLFWFWVSAVVILSAAQFNKVIEDASPLGKPFGQREEVAPAPPDMANIRAEPSSR